MCLMWRLEYVEGVRRDAHFRVTVTKVQYVTYTLIPCYGWASRKQQRSALAGNKSTFLYCTIVDGCRNVRPLRNKTIARL